MLQETTSSSYEFGRLRIRTRSGRENPQHFRPGHAHLAADPDVADPAPVHQPARLVLRDLQDVRDLGHPERQHSFSSSMINLRRRSTSGRTRRFPSEPRRRAAAITTADVNKFIVDRQAAGASNGEINRELAALKRAFSLATKAGKVMVKPYIPMLKENNVRKGFFERDQFESLRSYLPEDLRGMVTFVHITGWRIPSEVLPLQWRQVDFQAGAVRLDPGTTKNGEGREFPFTAELREVLEQQKAKRDALVREKNIISPFVFHRGGSPIHYFRRSWIAACKKAGLPGRIPHDFRRTAVRNLVRAGIPERVAMMMTGHKTRSVFERYNIVSSGDLAEAARKLDEARESELASAEKPNHRKLRDKLAMPSPSVAPHGLNGGLAYADAL